MFSRNSVLKIIEKINSKSIEFNSVSKSFCLAPFTTLYMGAVGENRLCCISKNRSLSNDIDTPKDILKDAWTSDYFKDVRIKMINGACLEECEKCYEIEKSGGKSDRQFYNEVTSRDVPDLHINLENGNQKGTPIVLDVRPSNLCNLKCRMCDSNSSSGIGDEYRKHHQLGELFKDKSGTPLVDWFSDESMLNQIKEITKNCYKLKLLGGEPVILKSVYELLKWCVDHGYNKQLILDVTSNVFVLGEQFFEVLSHFRTWFHISIDGVGIVNDYIRYPSRFEKISINILKLLNMNLKEGAEMHLKLLATVNIYNILYIDQVIKWWNEVEDPFFRKEEILFNMLFYPEHLKIDLLPVREREKVIKKIEASLKIDNLSEDYRYQSRIEYVLDRMRDKDPEGVDKYEFERFIKSTMMYDKIRGQSIQMDLPELYDIFKDDFNLYISNI